MALAFLLTGNRTMTLKERLAQQDILIAPGIYDALTALLVEQAGFEAAFVSGSSMAWSQLGRPDIGLITLTEMALALERIRDRVDGYLLVDADSGYGNAFNVQRTVRVLERAGADAIQIEDQLNTKRPAEVTTRPVISTQAMLGKLKAALDARLHETTVISARSDAAYTLGVDAAMERAAAFLQVGVDMVFIEGLKRREDIERLPQVCAGAVPLLHNVINTRNSDAAQLEVAQLQAQGYSVALYPAHMVTHMANAGRLAAGDLSRLTGRNAADLAGDETVATIIGSSEYLSKSDIYDG